MARKRKSRLDLHPYRAIVRAVAAWATRGRGRLGCVVTPVAADPPHLHVLVPTTHGDVHAQFVVAEGVVMGAYGPTGGREGTVQVRAAWESQGRREVARMTGRVMDEALAALEVRAMVAARDQPQSRRSRS